VTDLVARANARLALWLARIGALALAVIAAVTFCDVVARYFFNRPLSFTVELTEMAMALVVYFGVGLVTHEDAHINADVVVLRLPPRWRVRFALVTNLLALGFLAVMVWRVWLRAVFLLSKGDMTPVWAVPLWPIAFCIAVGSVFLLTGVFLQLIKSFRGVMNPQEAAAQAAAPQPYRE
jgi:TRAP-type C4-dicarboxylate transport system permease small subunit